MDQDMTRLRALFDEAIQAPPERRGQLLDARCGDDAALRRRVEALIATAESDVPFLSDPTRAKPSLGFTATLLSAPLSEGPGAMVGAYKLLQLIGEGGFGSVFMAEQMQPVRRRVALKIIKLGMDTKQVIARFEAERQALALMDHPNIAKVLDGGATDAGRPYFVMEYVTGDPITDFADAHKLSLADRLALFSQVCHAVQHAHTKGIIHRDLKPSNVLVSMSDGKPFAKVIDFGIAKATGARLTDKTLFTEHRQLIGTPEYMSPEQAEGSPDIDTRTDVYALGVLLYELLTGATPFDAKRLRSAAFAEMQRIIKEEDPPAPSLRLSRDLKAVAATASARQSEPSMLSKLVKGELDWIVMKALDKDRGRRYESPNQLAADVQRHLAGEAVSAAPPSAGYRLRKFVRRNKGPVVAGCAIAAALVFGIAGTTWQWRKFRSLASHAQSGLSWVFISKLNVSDAWDISEDIRNADGELVAKVTARGRDKNGGGREYSTDIVGPDGRDVDGPSAIDILVDAATSAFTDLRTANAALKQERDAANAARSVAERQADAIRRTAYTYTIQEAFANWENAHFETANRLLDGCPEDLRGWEWRYVHDLSDIRQHVLKAHAGIVRALAFTPRSGVLASAGDDRVVKIWDCEHEPAKPRAVLPLHPAPVRALAFTPDERLLLTVCGDDAVRVWDAATGAAVRELRGARGGLNAVAVSKDGSWCAAAGEDHLIHLWSPATGEPVHELSGHDAPVTALCASPFGGVLISGDSTGWLMTWDVMRGRRFENGARQLGSEGSPFPILCASFGSHWDALIGPSPRGTDFEDSTAAPESLALPGITEKKWYTFAADDLGEIIARRTTESGYCWVGSQGSPEPGYDWSRAGAPDPPIRSLGLAVSADGRWAAVGHDDGTIRIQRGWHGFVPEGARLLWKPLPNASDGGLGSFFVAGNALFTSADGRLLVVPLDPKSESAGRSIDLDNTGWAAASADGRRAVAVRQDGKATVIDIQTGATIGGWTGGGATLALTRDGATAIEASGKEIRARSVPSGEVIRTILPGIADGSSITMIRLSPDEHLIAYGTEHRNPAGGRYGGYESGEVGVIEVASGRRLWEVGHFRPTEFDTNTLYEAVSGLRFDPASSRLLVSGASLTLWDAEDGAQLGSVETTWVKDMCFASDGTYFFTAHQASAYGRKSAVSAWSTSDMRRVVSWTCDDNQALCLNPDGRQLLIGGVGLWTIALEGDRGATPIDAAIFHFRQVSESVDRLSESAVYFADVVARIEATDSFSDSQKLLARGLVPRAKAQVREDRARKLVAKPGERADQYTSALADARFAASVRPTDGPTNRTLGAALYRNGLYAEALDALVKADALIRASGTSGWEDGLPSCVAFLAMTQSKLGQVENAAASLSRLRVLADKPAWRGNAEAAAYVTEAATLIEPSNALPWSP